MQSQVHPDVEILHTMLRPGDLIFTAVPNYLYRKVATGTHSWTSHVGFVHSFDGKTYWVAESAVPFSRLSPLQQFIARSNNRMFSVRRLRRPLGEADIAKLQAASGARLGKLYHSGFNYDGCGQFCSKFVYDVYQEALGEKIGELQSFAQLLEQNPDADLGFWRLWFLGRIPWRRRTVTPSSQLASPQFDTVYQHHIAA